MEKYFKIVDSAAVSDPSLVLHKDAKILAGSRLDRHGKKRSAPGQDANKFLWKILFKNVSSK